MVSVRRVATLVARPSARRHATDVQPTGALKIRGGPGRIPAWAIGG
jgi:hypothetical protein